MNVQSRLLGYFSGKPGDLMTPLLEVKFLEHSGPEMDTERKEKVRFFGLFTEADGARGEKNKHRRRNTVVCVVLLDDCMVYGPWWRPTLLGIWLLPLFLSVWANDEDEKKTRKKVQAHMSLYLLNVSLVGAYNSTIKKRQNMSIMLYKTTL